jgi:hypothetical protein
MFRGDAMYEYEVALATPKYIFYLNKLVHLIISVFFGFPNCCISVFQILFSTEVVTRLSHDQVALFKTFRDTAQNCAR